MTISEELARKPRQTALIVFALMHLAMSMAILGQPSHFDHDLSLWHTIFPLEVRVAMWSIAGFIAAIGVFFRSVQTIGFVVATIMPTGRALSHLWSWIMSVVPGGPSGQPFGIWEAVWWGLLAFLTVWSAGLIPREIP